MSRLPPALPGLRGAAEPRPGAGSGCAAVPGLLAARCSVLLSRPGDGCWRFAAGLGAQGGLFFFFFSNICILISIKEKKISYRNEKQAAAPFLSRPISWAVSCLDQSQSGTGLPALEVSSRACPGYPGPAAMFVAGTVAQRCPSPRVAPTRPWQLLPRPAPTAPARLRAATFCPLIESHRLSNASPIRGPKLGCSLAGAGKDAPLCNRCELIAPDDLNNAVPVPHRCGVCVTMR